LRAFVPALEGMPPPDKSTACWVPEGRINPAVLSRIGS
jgi:hypothetical protein